MSLWESVKAGRNRRRLVLAGLWMFIATVLIIFRQVLVIFAVAALIAFVLQPAVRRMSRWDLRGRHLPRWSCVILLYLVFFGAVYLLSLSVVPQVVRESRRLTAETTAFLTPERIQHAVQSAQAFVEDHGLPLDFGPADEAEPGKVSIDTAQALKNALESSSEEIRTSLPKVVGYAQQLVGQTLNVIFTAFFMLMVAAFMLIDWEEIKTYVFTLLPTDYRDGQDELLGRIDASLSGVVRGQLVICMINGSLTLVGLLLLKVKFAFVLSGVATILSLVPVFGSILSSVPIVAVGLTQGWHTGLGALAWIIGIHALEAYFLNPKIMGAAAKIHPLVVAFALVAGERTYGFAGALFAVPLASIVINIFEDVHRYAQRLNATPAASAPVVVGDAASKTAHAG